MDLFRLRFEVPDSPGEIGNVLVALGRFDIDIVEIDCHNVNGTVRVDDLFIHAKRPLDPPAIAQVIEEAGCSLIEMRPISVHDLEDPVTRAMRLTAELSASTNVSDELIAWCAGELVRADLATVIDDRAASLSGVAARALREGVAVHGREWVKRLPNPGAEAWTLAVPFERTRSRAAVVVSKVVSPFTRTETARLRALLGTISTPRPVSRSQENLETADPTWDLR